MARRVLAGLLALGMGLVGTAGLTAAPAAAAEVEFGSCATPTSTDCIVSFRFKPSVGNWTDATALGPFDPSAWPRQVWQTPGLFHEAQPLRLPAPSASYAPSGFTAAVGVVDDALVSSGAVLGTVSYDGGRVSRTLLAPLGGTVDLLPAPTWGPGAVGQPMIRIGTTDVNVPAWSTPGSGWALTWNAGVIQGSMLPDGQSTIGSASVTIDDVTYRADFTATGPARIDALATSGTFEAGAQVATISSDRITFDARYDAAAEWGSFLQVQPQAVIATDAQALAWPGVMKCGPENTISWSPTDDPATYDEQCYRSPTLNPDALYEVTVRTSQVIPMFASGRMSDMEASMSRSSVAGSFDLTFRGGLRSVQFIAKGYEDVDVIDGVMQDWSVYFQGAPLNPCLGEGVASGASNGFGTPQPTVDEEGRIILETSGRHFGIDGTTEYVGAAEMVIPDALATCLWDADLDSLTSIVGAVEKGGVAQAATVTVTRRSGFTYIETSGYTYSSPTLVAQLPTPVVPAPASGSPAVSQPSAPETSTPTAVVSPVSGVTPTPPSSPPTRMEVVRPVAAGLVVLPTSLSGTPRIMARPPAATIDRAPVVSSAPGRPIALVASGLTPGDEVPVKIRIGKRYVALGTAIVSTNGRASLPAFRLSRPGTYRLAILDPTSGKPSYIKVVVTKRERRA